MDDQIVIPRQVSWLLEGDPAIRYQTLRDLTNANRSEIDAERSNILRRGWGRRLLELQEADGTWSHALYSPKWTSTFYTVLLLKRFGAPVHNRINQACNILLDKGFYPPDGGINYWKSWKQSECCVTGMLLSMLCFFEVLDDRIHRMVDYILTEQMSDGGWNCQRYRGASHSSFHTTISVLEGLWEYQKLYPGRADLADRQKQGVEFLLQHRLYKSDHTWKIVDPKMTRLSFPPRWHYDILRCLDYFQDKGVVKDGRMKDAVDLLHAKRSGESFWKLELKYPGKIFFDMEKVGQPSRWNTLRALRVLKWWYGDAGSAN